MPNSTYLDNIILDYKYGNVVPTSIGNRYLALFTTMPTSAGGGVEVAGGSYARVLQVNNLTNFPAAVGGSKKNATAFNFGTATADWGVILGAGFYDALTSGNLLDFGLFGVPITVLNTNPFSIAINGGTFTVA